MHEKNRGKTKKKSGQNDTFIIELNDELIRLNIICNSEICMPGIVKTPHFPAVMSQFTNIKYQKQ